MALKGYPRWMLTTTVVSIVALALTGLLLTPTTLVVRFAFDIAWRLPSAYRIMCSAAHAAFGSAALLVVGSLWSVHMRSGWARGQHRTSGLLLAMFMLLLAASALFISYAGEAAIGDAAALVHLIGGGALAAVFGWHWWRGACALRQRIRKT